MGNNPVGKFFAGAFRKVGSWVRKGIGSLKDFVKSVLPSVVDMVKKFGKGILPQLKAFLATKGVPSQAVDAIANAAEGALDHVGGGGGGGGGGGPAEPDIDEADLEEFTQLLQKQQSSKSSRRSSQSRTRATAQRNPVDVMRQHVSEPD
jgi:hypothetical protein